MIEATEQQPAVQSRAPSSRFAEPDTQRVPGNAERGTRNAHLLGPVAALAAFTALTVIATWPFFANLGGYVFEKRDPLYSVWAMAWQAHALGTDPLHLFDTNVMYPFKGTLAFDELSFAEAVLAAPFYALLGNPVLSHNLLLFATFVLSGFGAWLLVRELTGSGWAGLVAGSAYAFSFYRFNHLPHMTLENAQWLPFILWCAYRLLATGEWRWTRALAVLLAVQALSGHYLAFYAAMLLGGFVLFYFVAWRSYFSRAVWLKLGVAGAASLVLTLPVLVPYVALQQAHEFRRNVFEIERFSNTLASFLAVHRGNPLYQALLAPFADPGPWALERASFPGLAVPMLAIVGLLLAWRSGTRTGEGRRPTTAIRNPQSSDSRLPTPDSYRLWRHAIFFALVVFVSALLSLGPSLQVSYPPSVYDPSAIQRLLPLPYGLLYEWVPGFQSMRVVARIGILTSLGLSVLAGFGAFSILRALAARRNGRLSMSAAPVVAAGLCLLPVFESWSVPLHMEPVGTRSAVPPVYRWLAQQPRTIILEYPMVHHERGDASVVMANTYQYYSVYHWHHTINASTSIRPYAYSALVEETEKRFPSPRSLDALWALGVEYLVVHLENLSGPQREEFLWRVSDPVARVVDDLVLVQDFGADRVYRLKSPREVGVLRELVPPGASVLLASPDDDPQKPGDALVGGGYMAALGHFLRDHPVYGDPRLSYGQTITEPDFSNRPDYALLWADQEPATAGYRPENRVWANEHVALYRIGRGIAGAGRAP